MNPQQTYASDQPQTYFPSKKILVQHTSVEETEEDLDYIVSETLCLLLECF
jgi:hypothetical protein